MSLSVLQMAQEIHYEDVQKQNRKVEQNLQEKTNENNILRQKVVNFNKINTSNTNDMNLFKV